MCSLNPALNATPLHFVVGEAFRSLLLTFHDHLPSQYLSVQPLGEVVNIGVHDRDVKEAKEGSDD